MLENYALKREYCIKSCWFSLQNAWCFYLCKFL